MALSKNRLSSAVGLETVLNKKLQIAVDYLIKKIWEENRSVVEEVVYKAYNPTKYERTGEFKEAWETQVTTEGNKIQGQFNYAPDKITTRNFIQHEEQVVEYLADIIYQGLSGDFGIGPNTKNGKRYAKNNPLFQGQAWTQKRDAWKELENRLGARKLKAWMKEGFAKAGLAVKSNRTSWGVKKW